MLDVNIEFSKGVLFVRLSGDITNDNASNIKNNVVNILTKSGIKYLVFNISDAVINNKIDLFEKCNEAILNNNGRMIICGNNDLNYESAKNELTALRMMSI